MTGIPFTHIQTIKNFDVHGPGSGSIVIDKEYFKLPVKAKKIDPRATLPTNKEGDAGWDLYALEDAEVQGVSEYGYGYVGLADEILAEYLMSDLESNDEAEQQLADDTTLELENIEDYKPTKIKTGIALEIPPGYVGLICDRSGMGSKGFKVMGGVVDSIYRGDVTVCLTKTGKSGKISAGDRIAQILFIPIANVKLIESEELTDTARGEKGFGSSGR